MKNYNEQVAELKSKIGIMNTKQGGVLIKVVFEYKVSLKSIDEIIESGNIPVNFDTEKEAFEFIEKNKFDALEPFKLSELF